MSTVRECLLRAESFLTQAGIQDARQESRLIVSHLIGCNYLQIALYPEQKIASNLQTGLNAILARRKKREPLQYILGSQAFLDMELIVNANVLIPRPETEELTTLALARIPLNVKWQIADMGCGSGAIGIAIANKRKQTKIFSSDISEYALQLAYKNAQSMDVLHQLQFLKGDQLMPFIQAGLRFQMFISNPPYISEDEWQKLEPEVRDYEPKLALVPDTDPLIFYRNLSEHLGKCLMPHGRILLELDASRAEQIAELFDAYQDVQIHQDMQGRNRFLEAVYAPA